MRGVMPVEILWIYFSLLMLTSFPASVLDQMTRELAYDAGKEDKWVLISYPSTSMRVARHRR